MINFSVRLQKKEAAHRVKKQSWQQAVDRNIRNRTKYVIVTFLHNLFLGYSFILLVISQRIDANQTPKMKKLTKREQIKAEIMKIKRRNIKMCVK